MEKQTPSFRAENMLHVFTPCRWGCVCGHAAMMPSTNENRCKAPWRGFVIKQFWICRKAFSTASLPIDYLYLIAHLALVASRKQSFLCFVDGILLFFLAWSFSYFLPRENFPISTSLLVSWPSKDIASHIPLTQPHQLQIKGELNMR